MIRYEDFPKWELEDEVSFKAISDEDLFLEVERMEKELFPITKDHREQEVKSNYIARRFWTI